MNDLQESDNWFYSAADGYAGLIMLKRDLFFTRGYANTLGNRETGSIEKLPLESFEDVNEIPLNGTFVQNGNHTTDVYLLGGI